MDTVMLLNPDKLYKALVQALRSETRPFRKSLLALARYRGLPTDPLSNLYINNRSAIDTLLHIIRVMRNNDYVRSELTDY